MTVPDSFNLYKDFQYCEICEKDYTDDNFVAVVVDNDKSGAATNGEALTVLKQNILISLHSWDLLN